VLHGIIRLLLVDVRLDFLNPFACFRASSTATLRILTKLGIRCLNSIMLREVYAISFSDAYEAIN